MLLNAVGFDLPDVTIEPTNTKYNPNQKIIAHATVSAAGYVVSRWDSLALNSSQLEAIVLSPLEWSFAAGISIHQLVIQPNVLAPGLSYQFAFSAAYGALNDSNLIASAMMTITLNKPPGGGLFRVKPSNGYALNTTFYLST
jgi:hypothetical protein